ncbi:MAG: protein kinase [Gemmatimonadota bacterium]|nr:protein kinase [Gemmatimonadota bacterium]
MSDETPDLIPRLNAALAGKYDVIRELGRGGMATVYLASDAKHGREVAIKVLLPELGATLGAERFEREIRLAAKLQHPHILGLFDSGVADGLLYYVMPFVKGESVRDRIDREGMLPIEDAVQIALEVNDALGHAHSQGVVHRDIKPENIMLSGGHALVADFGIARAITEGGASKLTATGMSMGTPYYMAPEQASGETVGPTADLYALGCVLYEMLAGEPPFTGKNSMQIMARHAMEQVPSIRIVRNVVPEDIENAIFISMNKSPADRPQNAEQFAQLLGLPIGATASMRIMTPTMQRRVPSGAQTAIAAMQARPWWKKPLVLAGAAVAVAAVGVGAWSMSKGGGGASTTVGPEARRIAVLYFTDQSRDSSLTPVADGLTEGLTRALSGGSSFTVISTSGAARFRGSSAPPDSIAQALRAGFLVRGEVEPEGENVRISVRLDDASGANLKRQSITVASANVVGARDTLAIVVADLIRQELGEQFQLATQRASTSSSDAWRMLQRGEAARRLLEAAVARRDSVEANKQYRTADSLYAAAAQLDDKWSDPAARRALAAYRRARLTTDAAEVRKWVAVGIPHAAAALKLDADNPDALEQRGNLNYYAFLTNAEENAAKKAALIASAKEDLERATQLNKNQASAYSMLSHLYNNFPGSTPTDVMLAAQRAYEADEFLTEAEVVISRLVLAAYDLGQFEKADQWCAEAKRRFPNGSRTARCELLLLTTRAREPDIGAAWKLADSLATFAGGAKLIRLNSDMLVAMVIARSARNNPALADSARNVIKRSEGDAMIDATRDLALYGAMAAATLGDKTEAVRLLKVYLAVNPQKIAGFRDDPGWQYRDLTTDPAYRQLVGSR